MERLGRILSIVDHSLSTKKRRHILGGVLMSVSLLFGGLAVTVLSTKVDDKSEYELIYSERKE